MDPRERKKNSKQWNAFKTIDLKTLGGQLFLGNPSPNSSTPTEMSQLTEYQLFHWEHSGTYVISTINSPCLQISKSCPRVRDSRVEEHEGQTPVRGTALRLLFLLSHLLTYQWPVARSHPLPLRHDCLEWHQPFIFFMDSHPGLSWEGSSLTVLRQEDGGPRSRHIPRGPLHKGCHLSCDYMREASLLHKISLWAV